MKKINFVIGADPEIFISEPNGVTKSSIPILQTDKYHPIVLDAANGINLYADNSLAEFTLKPSKTKKEWINVWATALQKIQTHLGKKYRIQIKSAHTFKENELEEAYGIDPKEIGCNPEFDHWTESQKDLGKFESSMRSGSSHLHFSGPKYLTDFDGRHSFLKILEIYLGCASIIWDNDETSLTRRQKYGRSGSFRPTGYGAEARFMSNYIINSPILMELVYDIVEFCFEIMENGIYKNILGKINSQDIQDAINNCRKDLAESILAKADFSKELMERVMKQSSVRYNPEDVFKNWGIEV